MDDKQQYRMYLNDNVPASNSPQRKLTCNAKREKEKLLGLHFTTNRIEMIEHRGHNFMHATYK